MRRTLLGAWTVAVRRIRRGGGGVIRMAGRRTMLPAAPPPITFYDSCRPSAPPEARGERSTRAGRRRAGAFAPTAMCYAAGGAPGRWGKKHETTSASAPRPALLSVAGGERPRKRIFRGARRCRHGHVRSPPHMRIQPTAPATSLEHRPRDARQPALSKLRSRGSRLGERTRGPRHHTRAGTGCRPLESRSCAPAGCRRGRGCWPPWRGTRSSWRRAAAAWSPTSTGTSPPPGNSIARRPPASAPPPRQLSCRRRSTCRSPPPPRTARCGHRSRRAPSDCGACPSPQPPESSAT
mmetsp:Transcript_51695/g.143145  ORF Transcript_51695/g.143145 Transcript_51695/m.143145 type:complete len:294 (+) Transcript_51695:161-1042(+)